MANCNISSNRILLTLIIVFSIIPDVGIKVTTFGFNWTIYRMIIIVLTILIAYIKGVNLAIPRQTLSFGWIVFMLFWIIYGLLLMFISPYADIHNGFVELISLFNGVLTFFIVYNLVDDKEDILWAENVIFIVLLCLIAIAFYEILTGRHMQMSAFYDVNSEFYINNTNTNTATGFMYNINDFSALLTCLTPVLLNKKLGSIRYPVLLGVILVNLINDASICNLAIIVFVAYYFLIVQGRDIVFTFVKRLSFIAAIVLFIIYIVTLGLYGLSDQKGLFGAVSRQIINYNNSSGSLYVRITVYKETIKGWIESGFLGIGPKGFSNYFTQHVTSTSIINPHSLLLEILLEYGFIIATIFIIFLLRIFVSGRRLYKQHILDDDNYEYLIIMAFILIYVIASFAPSAFVGYSYQWLLLAIMCARLDIRENVNNRRDYI